ncbi:MAG: hypothetical protein JSR87_08845 [Proteobacteria bacterium]|nr:hypothetical protein [Pseudomonadota bacterium]MBS0571752.1 hypothetical protein [Pseudomonadota bacterium]
MRGARHLLPILMLVLMAGCSFPRAHANVHLTPAGVKVRPSLSTSIAGVGVSVSQ